MADKVEDSQPGDSLNSLDVINQHTANVTLRSKKIIVPLIVDSEEEQSVALDTDGKLQHAEKQSGDLKFTEQEEVKKITDCDIQKETEVQTKSKIMDGTFGNVNLQSPNKQIAEKRPAMDIKATDINLQLPKQQNTASDLKEKEIQLLRKENELLKKEKEIIERENNFMKLMSANKNNVQSPDNGTPLTLIGNFLPEFDGSVDAAFWISQLKDVQQSYKLSDDMLRALFATKLVGKPLQWLHTRRNIVTENLDEMFGQFCLVFGSNESKLEMRKKFERRVWRAEENFADYCSEKVKLAERLKLEDDELLEYIIEGIPNMQLRRQTVMQQYKNVNELCKSLAAIKLPKTTVVNRAAPTTKLDVRCYNCNSVGHYAADCGKPRRQPGTCYACGGSDHTVSACEQNKKKSVTKMENPYKAS
ncbi:uncharacterized protein [Musca autumnalis]|uniref:uncharacterized protein n=1 Tax=Musca autumnalis TaxID=221902 RepID=UPI003CFB2A0B